MNKQIWAIVLLCAMSVAALSSKKQTEQPMHTESVALARTFYPASANELAQRFDTVQQNFNQLTADLQKRSTVTVENTLLPIEHVYAQVLSLSNTCEGIGLISPDESIRTTAQDLQTKASGLQVDFLTNQTLFDALTKCQELTNLDAEQHFFLQHLLAQFKYNGMALPKAKRERVVALQKKIKELESAFNKNIANDNRHVLATHAELEHLGLDFIEGLEKDEAGNYRLYMNYPTVFRILDHCDCADVRKRVSESFDTRAHPDNIAILKQLIAKRTELAHLFGHDHYADYDVENQMVKHAQTADQFLDNLIKKLQAKEKAEVECVCSELPASVQKRSDGTIAPWDKRYIFERYKKEKLNVDTQKLSEYFPLESTMKELLAIYELFFDLTLKTIDVPGLWHEDVRVVEVSQNGQLLGILYLDLHPRANKYTHACECPLSSGIKKDGKVIQPVSTMVVANFPKPVGDKPSLLTHKDVVTIFHEMGHAFHELLGARSLASLSGTYSIKWDFVEMPSQMLESWLQDKEILRRVGKHYQTGQPLPDDLIEQVIALSQFDSATTYLRQAHFAKISLELHKNTGKTFEQLCREIHELTSSSYMYHNNEHRLASFGHLTEYGSKYYGYLWSKVFAIDLFEKIKEGGLLNPVMGKKYIELVIGKGSAQDPNEMIEAFLGRKPNQEAFLRYLGL